jgi:hypothetical protein
MYHGLLLFSLLYPLLVRAQDLTVYDDLRRNGWTNRSGPHPLNLTIMTAFTTDHMPSVCHPRARGRLSLCVAPLLKPQPGKASSFGSMAGHMVANRCRCNRRTDSHRVLCVYVVGLMERELSIWRIPVKSAATGSVQVHEVRHKLCRSASNR